VLGHAVLEGRDSRYMQSDERVLPRQWRLTLTDAAAGCMADEPGRVFLLKRATMVTQGIRFFSASF